MYIDTLCSLSLSLSLSIYLSNDICIVILFPWLLHTHTHTHTHTHIYIYIYMYSCRLLRSIRMWHKVNSNRSLTGLESEFSFSYTSCHIKVKVLSLLYYLPIDVRRIAWMYTFPKGMSFMWNPSIPVAQWLTSWTETSQLASLNSATLSRSVSGKYSWQWLNILIPTAMG